MKASRCRTCGKKKCQHFTVCDGCGVRYQIGDSYLCKDGHSVPLSYHPFNGYYDEHMISPNKAKELGIVYEPNKGVYVGSLADKWNLMKRARVDYAPRRMSSGHPEF